MSAKEIHFHDGPWAGKHIEYDASFDTIPVYKGDHSKTEITGHYKRDENSAGGRCFDWNPL